MSVRPRDVRSRSVSTLLKSHVAAIGAFASVPDVAEYESLERRVSALEASIGSTLTGIKSFQSTLQAQLTQAAELTNRVGTADITLNHLVDDVKALTKQVESHERSDLRAAVLVDNVSRDVSALEERVRRHERNESVHGHNHNGSRHEPKGFQENDSPHFMG